MDAQAPREDDRRFEWQIALDKADYAAMAKAYAARTRRLRGKPAPLWIRIVAWAFIAAVWAALIGKVGIDDPVIALGAGFVAGVLVLWGISLAYSRLAMPGIIERQNGTPGKVFSVVADAAGIESRTDAATLTCCWRYIVAIDETPMHYFLWPEALQAFVLPKRVLRGPEEATRLKAAAKDWMGDKQIG